MLFLSHLSHQWTRSKIYNDILISFDRFDTFDLDRMVNDGTIYGVILHEMGHILGLGSLWEKKFNDLLDENNDYRVGTKAAGVWSKDWVVLVPRRLRRLVATELPSRTGMKNAS